MPSFQSIEHHRNIAQTGEAFAEHQDLLLTSQRACEGALLVFNTAFEPWRFCDNMPLEVQAAAMRARDQAQEGH